MQEIRYLKTRDVDLLNKTLSDLMNVKSINPMGELHILFSLVETFVVDSYIIRSKDLGKWVFTDILDDDLVYQEYFNNDNFVIVESDLNLALARGIHYRVHKKMRP